MGRSNNSTRLLVDGEVLYKSRDVQRLDLKWKAAWIYILLTSDSSGFWETEFEILGFRIGAGGVGIKADEAKKVFNGMYDELSSGVWFIPSRIQHANKHGLTSKAKNQLWIFRNWIEQGVDIEKHSYLLQDSPDDFVQALKNIGKCPSPVYNPESRKNIPDQSSTHLPDHRLDHVPVAIVTDTVSASDNVHGSVSEDEIEEKFLNWFFTNYPIGIKEEDEIEICELLNKISEQNQIRTKVSQLKKLSPGMVVPAREWLQNYACEKESHKINSD